MVEIKLGLSIFLLLKIEVFCDNQYELYVNDSKKYMDKSFITRCRKGKFNNDKFPVCVEKRCSFNAVEACFFEDDDRKCKRDDFKIQSGSSINIKCDTGYQLSVSEETLEGQGSINCNKGRYPSFKCIPGVFYIISAKTGSRRFAGTDAKVYITLFGAGGSTRKIYFEGSFERNDVDEIRIMAKDIRPIKNVQIGHDGSGKSSSWYIDYVSIYVENMEEFYSFRNEEKHWVKGEIDLTLNKSGNDGCIDSFGKELKWNPKLRKTTYIFLGQTAGMSRRACKQACINYENYYCRGVYYNNRNVRPCNGFAQTEEQNFLIKDQKWTGSVYLRKCKDNV